mmetsp:Transcript_56201/g.99319  ORF Transcript_56201/g.99319 Transcript_56201/m.99319 type:complete len:678 (-) Transcript_56201:306-2339(-)
MLPLLVGCAALQLAPRIARSRSAVMASPSDTATFYTEKLCSDDGEECAVPGSDEFTVAILGDLHLDPRKMDDYYVGRDHFKPILEDAKSRDVPAVLVSLGDLGESKSVRPEETQELFAGTTECHELAAEFLSSFGVPYEVIGGNHDLEGIDEFSTDEENLAAFNRIHKKETMQFARQVADKTLLVGLGSTVFRSAKYTSHEVTIDDAQMKWFEEIVESHPAEDGWKIFVFTHAPPIGSGLRVLQENHVVNGCCWLNHSGDNAKFIKLVRKHRCIKAWFSGHFHLGQDYEDSITFPTIPKEVGPYPNRGSCVFAQTSVMRSGTSRDKRQQSRLLRGNAQGFEICTVNHADGGSVRLDATITYTDTNHEVGVYAHEHAELRDNDNFVRVFSPSAGDKYFAPYPEDGDGVSIEPLNGGKVDENTIVWWYMSCGRVLGIYDCRLIEYEPSTLAPLGLVVGSDELKGKRVVVVGSGSDACRVEPSEITPGMEGADCAENEAEEQAVLLVDDAGAVTVVQPNEDGSYWRKIVRNKMIRMKEKRRLQAGQAFAKETFKGIGFPEGFTGKVVSSWGPYTSIVGTATKTGVAGLTSKAEVTVPVQSMNDWASAGSDLAKAFTTIDKDGDGVISASELKLAIKASNPSISDAETESILARSSGSSVRLQDFVMLMLFKDALPEKVPA